MDLTFTRAIPGHPPKFVKYLIDQKKADIYFSEFLVNLWALENFFDDGSLPKIVHRTFDYLYGESAFVFAWRYYSRHLYDYVLFVYICPARALHEYESSLQQ